MSSQIRANGLSPHASKGHHRRTHSATDCEDFCGVSSKSSTTPKPSAEHNRFFNDHEHSSTSPYYTVQHLPSFDATPSASTTTASLPSPSSCKENPKQQPAQQATAFRLIAMVATALTAVLLCTRVTASSNRSVSLRATAVGVQEDHCAKRQSRRDLSIPGDRNQCASVLPAHVVEKETLSWLVSVHVDRIPSMEPAKRLRGAAPLHR